MEEELSKYEKTAKRRLALLAGSVLTSLTCIGMAYISAEKGDDIHKYYGLLGMVSFIPTWISGMNMFPHNEKEGRLDQILKEQGRL
jgi:hypothetical protein